MHQGTVSVHVVLRARLSDGLGSVEAELARRLGLDKFPNFQERHVCLFGSYREGLSPLSRLLKARFGDWGPVNIDGPCFRLQA